MHTADTLQATWGNNVYAARTNAGLSQASLGAAVDASAATISRIEAGKLPVSDTLKLRLAVALETTVADLFPFPSLAEQGPRRKGGGPVGRVAAVAALGLAFLIPGASTPAADAATTGACKPFGRPSLAATADWNGRSLVLSGTRSRSWWRGDTSTDIRIAGVGTFRDVGAPQAYRVTRTQAHALNRHPKATASFHLDTVGTSRGVTKQGPACSMRVA